MLEMKNVTKRFGTVAALDDLTMTVPQGGVYGLVGPNGAGKSTAIRHLTGIYRPDAGTVSLNGQPIWENPKMKQIIGYIPDDVFYFPSATMEDMRRFYRGMYPSFDDALFDRLYDAFRLPKKGQIRRFSKGMQKQAAFHLTLAIRPQVMILDEPVDGLDPVMRRQVMSLVLSDVAEHGTTVLISSHNLRELEDVCDHVGHYGSRKNAAGALSCGYAGQHREGAAGGADTEGSANPPRNRLRQTENPHCPGRCPDRHRAASGGQARLF